MSKNSSVSRKFRPAVSMDLEASRYAGYEPGTTLLKAGTVVKPGTAPLICDMIFERDVPMTLRDGVKILTDVYRPIDSDNVPAVVSWSPYGKRDGYFHLDLYPYRAGLPQRLFSGLEKFEGPDPAWWVAKGYAIVQPDIRGAYKSEGDMYVWDKEEGRDGYDFIEWLATQDWCSGKIGLSGSSWLGVAQWFIAAERPPHLAAISPWEGHNDVWRNVISTGGVVDPGFLNWLLAPSPGQGGIEDMNASIEAHPEFDEFWAMKRAAVENIDIPAYVIASWANVLHTMGTFEAWTRLQTTDRWLRIHNSLEWPDFYANENQEDLCRFFDRYLRDIDNGWESTPPVRITVLDLGREDIKNRPEADYPLSRAKERILYLDADSGSMDEDKPASHSSVAYDAITGETTFILQVTSQTEINGYCVLKLFFEADGNDDADIFVKLNNLSKDGEEMGRVLLPKEIPENAEVWEDIVAEAKGPSSNLYYYVGPWGRKRVSHRADTDSPKEPGYYPPQKLNKGEIVEVSVAFTPTALRINPGEQVRIRISGVNLTPQAQYDKLPELMNKGRHIIHTGGEYPSCLIVPIA